MTTDQLEAIADHLTERWAKGHFGQVARQITESGLVEAAALGALVVIRLTDNHSAELGRNFAAFMTGYAAPDEPEQIPWREALTSGERIHDTGGIILCGTAVVIWEPCEQAKAVRALQEREREQAAKKP